MKLYSSNNHRKQLLQRYHKVATEVYNKGRQVLQSVSGIIKCYRLILEST